MTRTIKRLALFALTAFALTNAAQAQVSGKTERMARGFGTTVVEVPVDGSFHEVMRVTVKPKSDGFCAVTSSFTAYLTTNQLSVTLADSSGAEGPWSQYYDDSGWDSGAITQTFDVEANVATKFYLNVKNTGEGAVEVEGTRMWVVCGIGSAQGSSNSQTFDGGEGF